MSRFGLDLEPGWDKTHAVVRSGALRTQTNSGCAPSMLSEQERTSLITRIVQAIRGQEVPCDVQSAALTLVGWLARRHGAEAACTIGVVEARKQSIAVAQDRG
jgi:hypothetical protein